MQFLNIHTLAIFFFAFDSSTSFINPTLFILSTVGKTPSSDFFSISPEDIVTFDEAHFGTPKATNTNVMNIQTWGTCFDDRFIFTSPLDGSTTAGGSGLSLPAFRSRYWAWSSNFIKSFYMSVCKILEKSIGSLVATCKWSESKF